MTDPPGSLQSFRYEGALMNRMLIAGAGIVAFLSGASGAWAFTTQPVNPETMSDRLFFTVITVTDENMANNIWAAALLEKWGMTSFF